MIYLILLFGFVVRLISLNQSLWLDEATTALVAKMSLGDLFTKFLPGDFHPPLYYLILNFWTKIFGYSEISLRMPSVIFGVGTVYLAFLISKKLFSEKVGLISAVLLATSGLSIYYSQEARMYALAAFLVCLLLYLFIEKKWVWFSITLALLGMTDYVSLFILPGFWVLGYRNKKFLLANISLFAAFILWAPIFIKQFFEGLSVKTSAPVWWKTLGIVSAKNMTLIPVKFILGRISFDNRIVYGVIVSLCVLVYFSLVAKSTEIEHIRDILRRPLKTWSCKVIWIWFLLPIFLGALVSFLVPSLTYFRFLFCLPPFYILVSKGVASLQRKQFTIFFAAILFINVLSSGYYLFDSKFQREDWRSVVRVIGSGVIVVPADSQKEALIYYGEGKQIVDATDFSGGPKEIWLSRYVWQISDPMDSARNKIEKLGYNKVAEYNFNGVVFWKYEKI